MNKIKLLIIGVVVVFLIIVFIIISFIGSPKKNGGNTGVPPTNSQQNPERPNQEVFTILSFTPTQTENAFLPNQPVMINFNKPVLKEGIKYSVSPSVETYVTQGVGKNSLVISPKTIWANGQTTITILTTTTSSTNEVLSSPKTYVLHTDVPTIPQLKGAY